MSARLVYELCRMALADQPGVVVMLKAYVDESGTHDASPVLTVAAYWAKPRQWESWTKRWNEAKRPFKVYHATDVANQKGEFAKLSPQQTNDLWLKVLPVLQDLSCYGIVVGIQMDEFKKAMEGRDDLRALFGSPYAACFQWLVQIFLNIQHQKGSNEHVAFMHECNDYRQDALEGFSFARKYANPQKSIISIQFGEKSSHTPLQAADILAYEGNKRLRDPGSPERRSWAALNAKGAVRTFHYGKNNMSDLLDRLEKIRDGRISEIDLGQGWNRARGPMASVSSE